MKNKLLFLIIFGVAFAFVEAVVVFYLRWLLGYETGYFQSHYKIILNLGFIAFLSPGALLLKNSQLGLVESLREFSTLVMLTSLAFIAGKNLKQRLAAFLITFALWDIFYYIFLVFLTGWPKSLFDSDVFFLIPIPWVGPVITPVIISLLLLLLGLKWFFQEETSH